MNKTDITMPDDRYNMSKNLGTRRPQHMVGSIVPFHIIPDFPNKFPNNTGTCYRHTKDEMEVCHARYRRTPDGTFTVEENGNNVYTVKIDFTHPDGKPFKMDFSGTIQ